MVYSSGVRPRWEIEIPGSVRLSPLADPACARKHVVAHTSNISRRIVQLMCLRYSAEASERRLVQALPFTGAFGAFPTGQHFGLRANVAMFRMLVCTRSGLCLLRRCQPQAPRHTSSRPCGFPGAHRYLYSGWTKRSPRPDCVELLPSPPSLILLLHMAQDESLASHCIAIECTRDEITCPHGSAIFARKVCDRYESPQTSVQMQHPVAGVVLRRQLLELAQPWRGADVRHPTGKYCGVRVVGDGVSCVYCVTETEKKYKHTPHATPRSTQPNETHTGLRSHEAEPRAVKNG